MQRSKGMKRSGWFPSCDIRVFFFNCEKSSIFWTWDHTSLNCSNFCVFLNYAFRFSGVSGLCLIRWFPVSFLMLEQTSKWMTNSIGYHVRRQIPERTPWTYVPPDPVARVPPSLTNCGVKLCHRKCQQHATGRVPLWSPAWTKDTGFVRFRSRPVRSENFMKKYLKAMKLSHFLSNGPMCTGIPH